MLFMILLPGKDPIFGFERFSKKVDTLNSRNIYVTKTALLDSESKHSATTRCIHQLVPFMLVQDGIDTLELSCFPVMLHSSDSDGSALEQE